MKDFGKIFIVPLIIFFGVFLRTCPKNIDLVVKPLKSIFDNIVTDIPYEKIPIPDPTLKPKPTKYPFFEPDLFKQFTFDNYIPKKEEAYSYRIVTKQFDRLINVDFSHPESLEGLKHISILPNEEVSFKKVFSEDIPFSQKNKNEIDRTINRLKKFKDVSLLTNTDHNWKYLQKIIEESSNEKLIIISGHSIEEDGKRYMILPNGDPISIFDLHLQTMELGKLCFILTCNSSDFRLKSKITFNEIAKLSTYAEKRCSKKFNPQVIKKQIKRKLMRMRTEKVILYSVSGSGASYSIIEYKTNRVPNKTNSADAKSRAAD